MVVFSRPISEPFSSVSGSSSNNYNIFGYDPNGVLAHLCAYFFGPSWRPTSFKHLPRWKGEVLPPRFGPPGPQQAECLPKGFTENPPPMYYGCPRPPYLPGPRLFDPEAFSALKKPARLGLPVDLKRVGIFPEETADGGEF